MAWLIMRRNPVSPLSDKDFRVWHPRVSRLVRDRLSFSKKLANYIGAIKFFIGHYNLAKAAALPV